MTDRTGTIRTAFVTGASRGIGRACAIALAESGARVVLAARDLGKLEEVAVEIRAMGREAHVVTIDLASADSIKEAFAGASKTFGKIDILVNNAGVTRDNLALRMKKDDWDMVLATNLTDVPAEVIVLLYRFRWLIELFFRWLKCVLSCRHLISQSANGIQIQMYCALIACLLIQLATGQALRPNRWTYKLLCLYAQGWATEEEVLAHLREREQTSPKPAE